MKNEALRAFSVWVVLGGRSLGREALLLADAMERGAVVEARLRAPALVGRDPAGLGVFAQVVADRAVHFLADIGGDELLDAIGAYQEIDLKTGAGTVIPIPNAPSDLMFLGAGTTTVAPTTIIFE